MLRSSASTSPARLVKSFGCSVSRLSRLWVRCRLPSCVEELATKCSSVRSPSLIALSRVASPTDWIDRSASCCCVPREEAPPRLRDEMFATNGEGCLMPSELGPAAPFAAARSWACVPSRLKLTALGETEGLGPRAEGLLLAGGVLMLPALLAVVTAAAAEGLAGASCFDKSVNFSASAASAGAEAQSPIPAPAAESEQGEEGQTRSPARTTGSDAVHCFVYCPPLPIGSTPTEQHRLSSSLSAA
mmetsp:Transcript_43663/g.109554  ORF Transcript_43663/g.109554 Transcript_43663/m.109554 type:complete len:245 (-) Transcript_43663:127-861(-)